MLDQENAVDTANLDFNKASDKITHNILVHKMKICDLDPTAVRWICNSLTDHTQKLVLNGFFMLSKSNKKCNASDLSGLSVIQHLYK